MPLLLERPRSPSARRQDSGLLLSGVSIGAILVLLGFQAGGFFPAITGWLTAAAFVLVAVHLVLARTPLDSAGVGALVLVGALAALAALALASSAWSGAAGRSLLEHDRALLYALAALIGVATLGAPGSLRALARGIAAGMAVIALAGLASRLLPGLVPTDPSFAPERLSWPITYWNAMGLISGLAIVLLAGLAADARERRPVRIGAAALLPPLVVALLLTFARGPIALTALGLVLVLLIARPAALAGMLVSCAVPVLIVVLVTLQADVLTSASFRSDEGVSEGLHVLLVTLGCSLWAGLFRAIAVRHLDHRRPPRTLVRGAAIAASVLAASALVAAFGSGFAERQWDRFARTGGVEYADPRARLLDPGNNGRVELWKLALDLFAREPLRGTGAGTYALRWDAERPVPYEARDGHSLYLETLAELGLAGGLLLAIALGAIVVGLARRVRADERVPAGILLAAVAVWLLHAGIDWDWELPVTTLWVPLVGGAALARIGSAKRGRELGHTTRVLAALACLVGAVMPVRVALSQQRLDDAVTGLQAGDCAAAQRAAVSSLKALGARAEPWEVIGYCQSRAGRGAAAERALREAIRRDRASWELWYGLALVRGAAGEDPRAAARAAVRRNPRSIFTTGAVEALRGDDPVAWRREARRLPLPLG